jgi:hypothetical protein
LERRAPGDGLLWRNRTPAVAGLGAAVQALVVEIHEKRGESSLSHPVKRKGAVIVKRAGLIRYGDIFRAKKYVRKAALLVGSPLTLCASKRHRCHVAVSTLVIDLERHAVELERRSLSQSLERAHDRPGPAFVDDGKAVADVGCVGDGDIQVRAAEIHRARDSELAVAPGTGRRAAQDDVESRTRVENYIAAGQDCRT